MSLNAWDTDSDAININIWYIKTQQRSKNLQRMAELIKLPSFHFCSPGSRTLRLWAGPAGCCCLLLSSADYYSRVKMVPRLARYSPTLSPAWRMAGHRTSCEWSDNEWQWAKNWQWRLSGGSVHTTYIAMYKFRVQFSSNLALRERQWVCPDMQCFVYVGPPSLCTQDKNKGYAVLTLSMYVLQFDDL